VGAVAAVQAAVAAAAAAGAAAVVVLPTPVHRLQQCSDTATRCQRKTWQSES
jgi:microcompartment protein CcmL/EutN